MIAGATAGVGSARGVVGISLRIGTTRHDYSKKMVMGWMILFNEQIVIADDEDNIVKIFHHMRDCLTQE